MPGVGAADTRGAQPAGGGGRGRTGGSSERETVNGTGGGDTSPTISTMRSFDDNLLRPTMRPALRQTLGTQ